MQGRSIDLNGVFLRLNRGRSNRIWTLYWPSGAVDLSWQQGLILGVVLIGGHVRLTDVIDLLWGDDESGGPLDADNTVKVHTHRIRHLLKINGAPWTVEGSYGPGLRLVPISHDGRVAA